MKRGGGRADSRKREMQWKGLRWLRASESGDFKKADVARSQRVKWQWERGKQAGLGPAVFCRS